MVDDEHKKSVPMGPDAAAPTTAGDVPNTGSTPTCDTTPPALCQKTGGIIDISKEDEADRIDLTQDVDGGVIDLTFV